MPLANCKGELKLKWSKYCILSGAGNDNDNSGKNIIFTIKDTTFYVPVVTLLARDNQQLSKLLSKGLDQYIAINIKQK